MQSWVRMRSPVYVEEKPRLRCRAVVGISLVMASILSVVGHQFANWRQDLARTEIATQSAISIEALPVRKERRVTVDFPDLEDSSVLFLHVFKCAGTTLRQVFIQWAERQGYRGAVVTECNVNYQQRGVICLNSANDLADPNRQSRHVASHKVLVGHFFWGFQRYIPRPSLMVTTLRNPLELFVSGQQFIHRKDTSTLPEATSWMTHAMSMRLKVWDVPDVGFLRRFADKGLAGELGKRVSRESGLMSRDNSIEHLRSFWLVGVVEQYSGFLETLRILLDPRNMHSDLWASAHHRRENSSPVSSRQVLANLDPELVRDFNASHLTLEWAVYTEALDLWDARCRELLPVERHREYCMVPAVPTSYVAG